MDKMITVWADENIIEYTDDEDMAMAAATTARRGGARHVELWSEDGLIAEWCREV